MAVRSQLHGNVTAEGRTPAADVHGYVQHGPFDYADQLALAELPFLEMQAAQDSVR